MFESIQRLNVIVTDGPPAGSSDIDGASGSNSAEPSLAIKRYGVKGNAQNLKIHIDE